MLALVCAGCRSARTVHTVEPVRVETLVLSPSSAVSQRGYVGVIEEEQSAALSFPLGGTVAGIGFDEGQQVRQGDLLARLDPTSAQQSYEAAAAALGQARDACERLEKLYDNNSLPEIQWVDAQTKLRQAESAFGIAEKNLGDCELRAPFSGVVGARMATVGETALPGVPVITLLQIGRVKVRFAVPEGEIAALRADDGIEVCVAALGDRVFSAGRIEKGAKADAVAHTYDALAVIDNPAGELLPGMVCRVVVASSADDALVVPVGAVQQAGDGRRFVWTVRGDSAVRTTVETGRMTGDGIEIVSGAAAGDRIVTGGMQKIGEGSKVVWQ